MNSTEQERAALSRLAQTQQTIDLMHAPDPADGSFYTPYTAARRGTEAFGVYDSGELAALEAQLTPLLADDETLRGTLVPVLTAYLRLRDEPPHRLAPVELYNYMM